MGEVLLDKTGGGGCESGLTSGKPQMTRQPTFPDAELQLSASDGKELARLIGKYGRKTIVEAAKQIPLRSRGRPRQFFHREDIQLAAWFQKRVEEYRRAGKPKPYVQTEIDLYENSGKIEQPDFAKFRKMIKKRRLRGRKEAQLIVATLGTGRVLRIGQ